MSVTWVFSNVDYKRKLTEQSPDYKDIDSKYCCEAIQITDNL